MYKIFYPRFFAWINLFSLNHILLYSLLFPFQSIQTYVAMVYVFWTTPISTPKRYSWQLTVSKNDFFALQFYSFTVLENVFFKMPRRKVNVITERRIFGDDNDLPRDIRDMKSGVSGDSLLRYSSDTGSMTSVACLLLCILYLVFVFVFVKVTAYRHFTFAV